MREREKEKEGENGAGQRGESRPCTSRRCPGRASVCARAGVRKKGEEEKLGMQKGQLWMS